MSVSPASCLRILGPFIPFRGSLKTCTERRGHRGDTGFLARNYWVAVGIHTPREGFV